jgi:TP53 regulating kinase-like protein
MIDFGLGQMQATIEDKAVDLYVLERAFISTHPGSEHLVPVILEAYRFACKSMGTKVLGRLDQVRMRGRKREMIG